MQFNNESVELPLSVTSYVSALRFENVGRYSRYRHIFV